MAMKARGALAVLGAGIMVLAAAVALYRQRPAPSPPPPAGTITAAPAPAPVVATPVPNPVMEDFRRRLDEDLPPTELDTVPAPSFLPAPRATPPPDPMLRAADDPTTATVPRVPLAARREAAGVVLFLDPPRHRADVGGRIELGLWAKSDEAPLAGYSTLVLFNPLHLRLEEVVEGRNRFAGYPFIVQARGDAGSIGISSYRGAAGPAERGLLHLATVTLTALEPGPTQVTLSGSELVDADAGKLALEQEQGAVLTITAPGAVSP